MRRSFLAVRQTCYIVNHITYGAFSGIEVGRGAVFGESRFMYYYTDDLHAVNSVSVATQSSTGYWQLSKVNGQCFFFFFFFFYIIITDNGCHMLDKNKTITVM